MEKTKRLIDEGHGIDVIFLDYRKAFDSVPYQRLLHKISELGVTRHMYEWLQNLTPGNNLLQLTVTTHHGPM